MKGLLLIAPLLCGFLLFSGEARAEQGCPDGFVPNPTWTQGQQQCIPGPPSSDGDTQPQAPSAVWAKRWGAISFDAEAGKYGTSNAMSSKRKAEKAAIQHCASKGAGACKVVLTYSNQCGAMAVAGGDMTVTSSATQDGAEASAMGGCNSKGGGSQCKIYYSDCSFAERVQ